MTLRTYTDLTKFVKTPYIPKKEIPVVKGKELEIRIREKGEIKTIAGKIIKIYHCNDFSKPGSNDFMLIQRSKEAKKPIIYDTLTGKIEYLGFEGASFTIFCAVSAKYTGN